MTPKPITGLGNRSTGRYWIGSNRRHDKYNRSLVNRVEDLPDSLFLMNWKTLLEENNRGKPVDCAIDSTGFKITIRGDYLGNKWNRKGEGWKKIHAVISIHDVSVISFTATDEHVHGAKACLKILKSLRDRMARIFGDRTYDSKEIFNTFSSNTVIPAGKNASTQSRGSPAGSRIVRQIRRGSERR